MLLPRLAAAQGVLIAPHAVFIDHRTRSGSVTLYNPGNDPVEVTVGVMFGYPVTDSAGAFSLYTPEPPDSTLPSATDWIEAFPRRTRLGPRERQTVRLLGRPPARLPDGEYWTRLVVTAKGGQVPVTGVEDTSRIKIGLTLEVRTILPVYYRKGPVTTGLRFDGIRAAVERDTLVVRPRLVRSGNAAFIGTVRGALDDSTGATVTSFEMPIAVFFDLDPRVVAPVPDSLPPGRYTLHLEAASEREDLAPTSLLSITPVRDSVEVRVP